MFFGARGGLTAAGERLIQQGSAGVGGTPRTGNRFCWSLAAGHFTPDRFADLVVGIPGQPVGSSDGADDIAIGIPFDDVGPGPYTDRSSAWCCSWRDAGSVLVAYPGLDLGFFCPVGQYWHRGR